MKINEKQLNRIIKESIKRIIKESSEDAWENLRMAKETGDPRQILDALHELEAQLESEGQLTHGTWDDNGDDKFKTRYSSNRENPMFGL